MNDNLKSLKRKNKTKLCNRTECSDMNKNIIYLRKAHRGLQFFCCKLLIKC